MEKLEEPSSSDDIFECIHENSLHFNYLFNNVVVLGLQLKETHKETLTGEQWSRRWSWRLFYLMLDVRLPVFGAKREDFNELFKELSGRIVDISIL